MRLLFEGKFSDYLDSPAGDRELFLIIYGSLIDKNEDSERIIGESDSQYVFDKTIRIESSSIEDKLILTEI